MEQQAPAPEQGGGIADALVDTDKNLAAIAGAMAKNPQIPDEVKAAFQTASQAYRQGMEAVMEIAGGGGAPGGEEPPGGGAVSPEAGASRGAVPMTPAGVRRG